MRTTPDDRVAEPYDDTAMKSNSTGRSIAAGQVAHEHERALEHADEQRRPPGVVGGDLRAELRDAVVEDVGGDDGRAELRIQHGRHRTVPSSGRAGNGARRRGAAARASGGRADHPRAPRPRTHPGRPRARARPRRPTAAASPSQRRTARRATGSGARPQHPRRRRVDAGLGQQTVTELVEQVRLGPEELGLAGEHRARGRVRIPRRASAAPRGGSTPAASARRRWSGRRPSRARGPRRRPGRRPGAGASSGRTMTPRRRAIPASPAAAEPRSTLSSTVSAWSSAVWATRIAVAPSSSRATCERAVPRVPRAGLEVRARRRRRRAPTATARRARRPRPPHDVDVGRAVGPQAVVDVDRDRREPGLGREHEQRDGVRAAGARDDHRARRARRSRPLGRGSPGSSGCACAAAPRRPVQPTATAPTRRARSRARRARPASAGARARSTPHRARGTRRGRSPPGRTPRRPRTGASSSRGP